jgi:hypothetical protein
MKLTTLLVMLGLCSAVSINKTNKHLSMLQDSSKSTDSEEDASDAISLVTDDGNFH